MYLFGMLSFHIQLNYVLIMISYDTYREIFKQLSWKHTVNTRVQVALADKPHPEFGNLNFQRHLERK